MTLSHGSYTHIFGLHAILFLYSYLSQHLKNSLILLLSGSFWNSSVWYNTGSFVWMYLPAVSDKPSLLWFILLLLLLYFMKKKMVKMVTYQIIQLLILKIKAFIVVLTFGYPHELNCLACCLNSIFWKRLFFFFFTFLKCSAGIIWTLVTFPILFPLNFTTHLHLPPNFLFSSNITHGADIRNLDFHKC